MSKRNDADAGKSATLDVVVDVDLNQKIANALKTRDWDEVRKLTGYLNMVGGLRAPPPPWASIPGAPTPEAQAATPATKITAECEGQHSAVDARGLLYQRLRMPGGFPKSKIQNAHIYLMGDKAFFFYVKDGTANVIEDEASLYPSDGFIAQIRLLLE